MLVLVLGLRWVKDSGDGASHVWSQVMKLEDPVKKKVYDIKLSHYW